MVNLRVGRDRSTAGPHPARADRGQPAASGVYFPAVVAQGAAKVGKMVLVR